MTQRKLEPRTVLLNCCSAVFPRRPSSDFLRSICCAAVTKLLLADVPWPGRRSEWGGELKVGVCELGGGGALSIRPSILPVRGSSVPLPGRSVGGLALLLYVGAEGALSCSGGEG